MNFKEKDAIASFRSGYNCAQAVLTTFTDDFKIDKKTALLISSGFGAGMGRLQETCGAVTGAFMVAGIYNCQKYTNNVEKKDKMYAMIQNINKMFVDIHGTSLCRELLNCDLKTEEGQKFVHENNLHEVVCEKCISSAINILEELIEK